MPIHDLPTRNLTIWDFRFLQMAKLVSTWSKDPSTQTGAIITDSMNRVIATGYNGFARGVDDNSERYNNRELKYKMIVHCERNAIIFSRTDLTGCRLYTWPFMSCSVCAAMVIQTGISECIAPASNNPRWIEDFKLTEQMFNEAGVSLILAREEEILERIK